MSETLPVLPLKDTVVFPKIVVPLAVGRPKSLAAIEAAMENGRQFIVTAQKDPSQEDPALEDLYSTGTIVNVTRVESQEAGSQVIVQGDRRVRILSQTEREEFLEVTHEPLIELMLSDISSDASEIDALLRVNREIAQRIASLYDNDNGSDVPTTRWAH